MTWKNLLVLHSVCGCIEAQHKILYYHLNSMVQCLYRHLFLVVFAHFQLQVNFINTASSSYLNTEFHGSRSRDPTVHQSHQNADMLAGVMTVD